jgi:hypothetical protein
MPRHATKGSFKKGHPGLKPKGAKCKFTTLKEAFVNAFKELGGEQGLIDWIYEQKKIKNSKGKVRIEEYSGQRKLELFKMIAKMLPSDVHMSGAEGEPLIPPEIKFVGIAPTEEPPK